MTTLTYKSIVKAGFHHPVEKIREGILSENADVLDTLVNVTADELHFLVDSAFMDYDDTSTKQPETVPKLEPMPPLLRPMVTKKRGNRNLERRVNRIRINSASEAQDPAVLDELMKKEISIIEELPTYTDFDMKLFETKELAKAHPRIPVEIRLQKKQSGSRNVNEFGLPDWRCKSDHDIMSLSAFATYQEEQLKISSTYTDAPNEETMIKFGTNFDLSAEAKWPKQLKELKKLPLWAHHDGEQNMIGSIYNGASILGMNTIQLYLKVPGCRTPGHQENNNMCSINLNVGPGDTEWFAVPYSCWHVVDSLCRKKKIRFLSDAWWPNLKELKEIGCPFYRFIQKPGDVVFVNVGCIHWVQAVGVCNNIAWNIGPITKSQYEAAMERYEYNKLEKFQSLVPMNFVSWNLARNPLVLSKTSDLQLVNLIQVTLVKCLIHITRIRRIVMNRYPEVNVVYRRRLPKEAINYCVSCKEELFYIYFTLNELGLPKYDTFCFECAKKKNPDLSEFGIIKEDFFHTLLDDYNTFLQTFRPRIQQELKMQNVDENFKGLVFDWDNYWKSCGGKPDFA